MRGSRSLVALWAGSRQIVRAYATVPPTPIDIKGKGKANFNVIDELDSRGFIAALTHPQVKQHVDRQSCIYAGVDPSASSLHVGNLVALMGLLHFQLAGHKVLALVGGATGSIGDPSGRSTERQALSQEILEENVKGITAQVHAFFQRGEEYVKSSRSEQGSEPAAPGEVVVLNNLEWFKGMGFLDFLRDVGKLARVNNMIARDSVKSRLNAESGISFTEFSYQLLQAYDFSVLHRTQGCRMQLGGSDQWGNIVAGIDLIKRQRSPDGEEGEGKEEAFGVTLPLLTTESGEKFGKSAGNAVWLDPERTSVSDFYQFFLRLPDSSIEQYLRLFTLLPLPRIAEIMREHHEGSNKAARMAQKILAEEITKLVHGPNALNQSQGVAQLLFKTPANELKAQHVLSSLQGQEFFHRITFADVDGISIANLAVQYGLTKSKADVSRACKQNALTLNGKPISDARTTISREDFVDGHVVVLKIGKKAHTVLLVDYTR